MIYKNDNFDAKSYLDVKGIKYFTSGKNTIKGAISTRCPFHSDRSNHLNIFSDGMLKCWNCGFHNISKYIKEIEQCNWDKVKQIIKQFPVDISTQSDTIEEYEEIIHPKIFKMPHEFKTKFPEKHKNYLEKRGFNWYDLRNKYGLLAADNYGEYAFRIIIPIIMDGKIVSFTSRDVTGKQSLKYKNHPDKYSLLPRNEWVMGIDDIKGDTIVITEGPLDYLKFGAGAVSLLTANFTTAQMNRIRKKGVRRVFIGFDPDEAGLAMREKMEQSLSWAEMVNFIDLEEGCDIGDLDENEIKELRRMIF